MEVKRIPSKVALAYFSGTGCTKAVCDCFEEQLQEQGVACNKVNMATDKQFDMREADTLIIFSPVYAFRLTSITETWVKKLPEVKHKLAIIISVSGGGEISPNTACRLYCKRLLKKKGYDIIYEKMIVMPSNFATQANQNLNLDILRVLPHKVELIISDIMSGKRSITAPKLQDRCLAAMGKGEHMGARFFGAAIKTSQSCNKCGLCVRNCPTKNIKMVNELPKFGFQCMWCLKCIYNCPCKALEPGILKSTVLSEGFDLGKMNRAARNEAAKPQLQQKKDILWQGVVDYLYEDDYLK